MSHINLLFYTCAPAQGISPRMLDVDFQEITIVGMNFEIVTCSEHIVIGTSESKWSNVFKNID